MRVYDHVCVQMWNKKGRSDGRWFAFAVAVVVAVAVAVVPLWVWCRLCHGVQWSVSVGGLRVSVFLPWWLLSLLSSMAFAPFFLASIVWLLVSSFLSSFRFRSGMNVRFVGPRSSEGKSAVCVAGDGPCDDVVCANLSITATKNAKSAKIRETRGHKCNQR